MGVFVEVSKRIPPPWSAYSEQYLTPVSIPAGIFSLAVLFLSLPANYPFQNLSESKYRPLTLREKFSGKQLRRIDIPGTVTLLLANVFLVAALEEANSQYSWDSAFVVTSLVLSGVSWIAFFGLSRWTHRSQTARESVFPWRFIQNRVCFGLLM